MPTAQAPPAARAPKPHQRIDRVAIRFAGDSGDGMQLTGTKFTESTALAGNDLSTLPDFPAEIRAPAGTLAGVSGFQIHFSSTDVRTPADQPDVLVAMNPAALKANLGDVRPGGMVIINSDAFSDKSLERAGYQDDPLPDARERFRLVEIPLTRLTFEALADLNLSQREGARSKNFFALGLMYWLYGRPLESTLRWIASRFSGEIAEANRRVLMAGIHFGETSELFPVSFEVPPAKIEPGLYRNITGNTALAWGAVAASVQMERPLFVGAYPITPASDVLHELAKHRHFGIRTFQAEDEIAAAAAAIGAAFAGQLALTVTSGPGFLLKQEALNLAVMTELPIVAVDVQRAGPSTGMPTKTEQADLLMTIHGRSSDSPVPVLAPATPGECFSVMIEAFRIAVKYMTPVVVLSDGYLANSAEPWKIPALETLPRTPVVYHSEREDFSPYRRVPDTLARPWAIPGTPGLEHRIGGIEKQDVSGNVSYLPANHQRMTDLRHEKVERIAAEFPPLEPRGAGSGRLLVVGWGGTHGAIATAVDEARAAGREVAHLHLRQLNPLPRDLGAVLARFERVLVPELNAGQLVRILRDRYLVPAQSYSKVQGQPFHVSELRAAIDRALEA
ncbi:MAG: 2-oxoacid:acceptor oxidoreductase subunit alpha [Deltaproteobacteria bacterium]|nr:2-oxoacid:acceptor oxidoreductase subunit alpha [Deltaproteobacteria bacterium]